MKKTIAIIFLIILTLLIGITIKSNAASSTDTMIWIDTPFENQTLEKGTINIQGWIMSKSKNSKLDILVDGKKVESEISRQSRQDVINAISGYGGRNENPTPGYIAKINISNISNGKHTLTVRALKEDGKTVLKEQKLNFKVGIYDTLIWIDTPSENSTQYGKINVTGWVMSDYSNNKIKILIDNKEQNIDILRQKRQDVINAISGYGKSLNKTPGYTAEIDISKLGSGTHKFTLNVYTTNGQLLETKTTNFKVKKPDTLLQVDFPSQNQKVKTNLTVQGWVMSEDTDNTVEVEINGTTYKTTRQSRPDVLNAISGYGNRSNKTPGYIANIDTKNIKDRKYTVKIRVKSKSGETLTEQTRNITIKKYETLLQYDTPKNNSNVKTSLTVQGWVMSEDTSNIVEVLLNGTTYKTERQPRQDVLNAISGYGNKSNKTPGYKAQIDTSNLKDGNYPVKVIVKTKNGEILAQESRNIKIKKYDTLLQFDTPKSNAKVKTTLAVEGWVLSEDSNNVVKVEFNGKTYETTRQARADVLKAVQGFGGSKTNKTPGYKAQIDTSNMKDGTYNLTVKVLNTKTNETLASETRKITIKKYAGIISIDYPQVTMINEDTLDIQGWIMTQDDKSTLKIYVDNKEISTNNIIRQERPDVINSISGYGTIKENPKPGFKTTINLKGYSEGKHTIKVTSTSRTGEIIVSGEKKFTIYKNEYFGIDVSEHQSMVNFYQMTQSNKLDFMLTRVGWYSESQGKLQLDTQFERNYKLAKQYKIPLGTYLYSYATNVQEAKNEANALVKYLRENNMSFELPVFYDMEDKAQNGANKDTKTQMCIEFCEILKKAGYKVGIYSSKNWLTNYIDLNKIPDDYNIWVASYGTNDGLPQENVKFPGNHDIWQYTSTGKIDGISTNVDFNICYKKYW